MFFAFIVKQAECVGSRVRNCCTVCVIFLFIFSTCLFNFIHSPYILLAYIIILFGKYISRLSWLTAHQPTRSRSCRSVATNTRRKPSGSRPAHLSHYLKRSHYLENIYPGCQALQMSAQMRVCSMSLQTRLLDACL